jgi:pimeloyl-ACP methyl ester carboxylesterase
MEMGLDRMTRLLLLLTALWAYTLRAHAQSLSYPKVVEPNCVTLTLGRFLPPHTLTHPRVILLVHGAGFGGFASFDEGQSPTFAQSLALKGFIVYLMNVRGWEGSTTLHTTTGSCVEAAQDLDAAIDYICRTENIQKVNLFGWATGGHWVSYYTTLHNDKVDHLIVLNTLYGVKGPWSLSSAFADPADSNRYNSKLPVYRESSEKAMKEARLNAIPFPDKTPWVDTTQLNYHAVKVPGDYRKESFNMAHGYQYWNARNIRVPTLIVRSRYDFWSRPIDVTTYYNDLTNAPTRKTLELPEATHFVCVDKPEKGRNQLISAIDTFIP